jgi:hypothetical protein
LFLPPLWREGHIQVLVVGSDRVNGTYAPINRAAATGYLQTR